MSYTILLIDDNRDFLRELSECLDEYNVVCAENGSQALAILRHPNEIDLVIVDQVLPDHKGTEVIKMIKKINPELEFILLTGYGSKEIAIDALRAKVDEYLEKPVQPERIKKTMAEMLARKTRGRDFDLADSDGIISRVKRIIEKNYDRKITLESISSIVFLSPKYLSRLFKEREGVGFNQYKFIVKLNRAKELLLSGGLSVVQIADKLGYLNPESFIRMFCKYQKTTPGAYRSKYSRQKSIKSGI
ncbi:hypothetical protein A2276_07670 [candidate division WOR-1 bacterium RIFOXYA12_FULL_43_27]|uniref:DNA-binding response regulator n=1 Tax=candidate division WOR-1 bacterium RIFOXYC2_FULL_46_14 TaxID=1802587 RepID=A0A1F4U5W5_UNCSA|nr:MAG: hypothetical protein A2276_07670 [candidate division WOR-1 bacterium RIFOXYA12_FULL_43_27]OGC20477.1 MAG: hypothetical protein A2292_05495 [candidate division WOR-1 bacterium RIFOXYB2_FULL_46_45]OGC31786.1 MAG: hypothetical protein A2232_05955 [candidate division WOR-1 bacterium RIFOXYA2_FULL_46_56]OGC40322.1 MAG: hypothetical protein A2438_03515 [candidate division WOR-1 bacterium RIFOXYC2_FULL_46_14]